MSYSEQFILLGRKIKPQRNAIKKWGQHFQTDIYTLFLPNSFTTAQEILFFII